MSLVSHTHKFIFIRPRKVAGISVQISLSRWLGEDDIVGYDFAPIMFNRHMDDDDFGAVPMRNTDWARIPYRSHELPDAIREKVGETVWAEYFKFTVARNPWDLLVSYLHYKFGPNYWRDVWGKRRPGAFMHNVPRALRLFRLRREIACGRRKKGLEAILREGLFSYHIEQIPQFYFCRGEAYADYVIRFENLQQGYDEVCRRLGLPPQILPRINTRQRPKHTDYRDYYTDFSREYIADLCRPMITAFEYRFGDGDGRHLPALADLGRRRTFWLIRAGNGLGPWSGGTR